MTDPVDDDPCEIGTLLLTEEGGKAFDGCSCDITVRFMENGALDLEQGPLDNLDRISLTRHQMRRLEKLLVFANSSD